MRFAGLTAICTMIAVAGTLVFDTKIFSRSLFRIFDDTEFSHEGMRQVMSVNPDDVTLYLPPLEEGKDFFESVRDLSILRREEVRKFVYLYLTTGRQYSIRAISRSQTYMDLILKILQSHPGMPPELALLPLLESGFDPDAVSRSRAVGLWQFMRETSAMLGLRTDGRVDERRHVVKSTNAAIRHLNNLYRSLGSWELALAAYNGGSGTVSRAISRCGSRNFWEIRDTGILPDETAEYLSRYAALMIIYQNRDSLGLSELFHLPPR